jgi:hypothetical protein
VDFGTFKIERVIIHQISKVAMSDKLTTGPKLSEAPSPLDDTRILYFESRIRASMQNAFEVHWDPDTTSPVPGHLVAAFSIDDDEDGVEEWVLHTQHVATHLHNSQPGMSSSGLLVFIDGTLGSGKKIGRCAAVMKLELENGVTVEDVTVDGKQTVEVSIESITLTEGTKVFKAGMFGRCSRVEDLSGWVSDDQLNSATAGRVVADYFLHAFLGCITIRTDAISTLEYLKVADEFVRSIADDETRIRYLAAIRADLNSNQPSINPEAFASQHLDPEDQDDFLHRLRTESGTVPSIPKNIDLVRARLVKTWVEMDNGLRLTGPPDIVEPALKAIREATDASGEPLVPGRVKSVR